MVFLLDFCYLRREKIEMKCALLSLSSPSQCLTEESTCTAMRAMLELTPSLFASSPSPQPDVVSPSTDNQHATTPEPPVPPPDDDDVVARRLGMDVTSEAFVRLGGKLISRAYDLESSTVIARSGDGKEEGLGEGGRSHQAWEISRQLRREIVDFFYAGGER